MSRPVNKNLLIVCEGTVTEPNYFDGLNEIIKARTTDYVVKITPKPASELKKEEVINKENELLTNKRRRRSILVGDVVPLIPEAYIAQPQGYVWEAQQGLIDGTFDEVWAVFDLDGHPKHPDAFELAKQEHYGKTVNIGFSSISFETWILLHHEYNTKAFLKSQCRTGNELHDCGQNTHEKDCNGENCVAGYLKISSFINKNDDVKKTNYKDLSPFTQTAINNAVMLRKEMLASNANRPIYEINPITTVDRLTFKLLNIPTNYIWTSNNEIKVDHFKITINSEENILYLKFLNESNSKLILQANVTFLVNAKGERHLVANRKIFDVQEEYEFETDLLALIDFQPIYFCYFVGEDNFIITELP